MPNRSLPGVGLRAFDAGENNWDDEYNEDHRLISAVLSKRVKSRTSDAPSITPALGDIYIVPLSATTDFLGQDNKLAVWDGVAGSEAWVFLDQTPTSWEFFVVDESVNVQWNGTSWSQVSSGVTYLDRVLIDQAVIDASLTTPPGSPSDSDAYIVAASATGAWAGQDNNLAIYETSSWIFYTPEEGWFFRDQTANSSIIWDGTAWAAFASGGGDVAVEDDNVEVVAAASRLNFGTGLSVTDSGSGEVEITADAFTASSFRGSRAELTSDDLSVDISAATAVSWDTATIDEGGWFSGASPTRLTVPAGVSHIVVDFGMYIESLSGEYRCYPRLNGSALVLQQGGPYITAGRTTGTTGLLAVSPGDYLELMVQTQSDTTVDLKSGTHTFLSVYAVPSNVLPFQGCMASRTSDLTAINASADYQIPFNTDYFDDDDWHDNVTNNTRITIPAGVDFVKIKAQIQLSAINATDRVICTIWKNGAITTPAFRSAGSPSSDSPALAVHVEAPRIAVVAGDYFELNIDTSADTSISIVASTTWLHVEKVS